MDKQAIFRRILRETGSHAAKRYARKHKLVAELNTLVHQELVADPKSATAKLAIAGAFRKP